MDTNKFLKGLNPLSQCKKYSIPFWRCPQVLFILMGFIIIVAILISYSIAIHKINDPEIVALTVLTITLVLIILDYIIYDSFERLAEASRMKSEFISIVSHQLRSPLSNLSWAVDYIMSGRLGRIEEKQLSYFKILRENTSRMKDLVNDLLTVSRIETGKLSLGKKEEVHLGDLTREIVSKFKPFIDASNVEVSLDIEENLPKIYADKLWLEQVISNLLDNAVRYIEGKGQVNIRISSPKKDKRILFEIKDNGVGIPESEQKFIFQKFFRSENALKHQTVGSGLGLFITKRIIEMMGGKIWFKSKESKGTTFYFTLPVKE